MCTSLMISVPTNPGSASPRTYVSARAMELPGVSAQSLYVIPSNQSWPLTPVTPIKEAEGWTTIQWTNQYGFVAIASSGESWQSLPSFIDGMNSAGLSVAAQWLSPGTVYPPIATPPSAGQPQKQVSYLDFPAWILGNFKLVSDFLSALPGITVVGPPPPTETAPSPLYVPLHYIVTDSTGQSAVIEFINGATNVYECTNGVMTNWPTYDWQLTNVKNYYNLTLVGTGTSITGAGNPVGGGLLGLPGDSLSSSRFVKATILSQGFSQLPADGTGWLPAPGVLPWEPNPPPSGFSGSEQTAVVVALQLVQICMGTPYGMLLESSQNLRVNPPTSTLTYGDYTMWLSVRDHNNLKYYFIPAFSGVLSMVDLSSLNFDAAPAYPNNETIAVMPQGNASWCSDVTAQLTSTAAPRQ